MGRAAFARCCRETRYANTCCSGTQVPPLNLIPLSFRLSTSTRIRCLLTPAIIAAVLMVRSAKPALACLTKF